MSTAPFQQGQLTHGKLVFKSGRIIKCDICKEDLQQATPSQRRHSGECQRIGQQRAMKRCQAAAKRRKNA